MKWVTRERAKVDRIACPWLIRKFIDSEAEFLFVPADMVKQIAEKENAIPFDMENAELGHYQENGIEHVSSMQEVQTKGPGASRVGEDRKGSGLGSVRASVYEEV